MPYRAGDLERLGDRDQHLCVGARTSRLTPLEVIHRIEWGVEDIVAYGEIGFKMPLKRYFSCRISTPTAAMTSPAGSFEYRVQTLIVALIGRANLPPYRPVPSPRQRPAPPSPSGLALTGQQEGVQQT